MNVPEVSSVPSDERQLVEERDAGDHCVGHADSASASFEVRVDAASLTRGGRVEGQHLRFVSDASN
jgi:hypothetical protein